LNPRPYRTGILLLCLLALALGIRVKAADWVERLAPPGGRFIFGDSDSYWQLGLALSAGEDFSIPRMDVILGSIDRRVFRTPGYPLLLAGMFFVAGRDVPVVCARYMSAVLGALAVAAVYWLALRLFDGPTALVAAAATAIYPGAIASSVFVLSEAPFCPLLVMQLVAQVAAWQAERRVPSGAWSFAAGVLAGAATLMRPSWLLFVPFAIVCGIAFSRSRPKQLACGICMLVGLVIVMAPWWVRNDRVTGHFVPTSLQVGASLYDGLNPDAWGGSDMSFVDQRADHEYFMLSQAGVPSWEMEYELDRGLRQAALAWAREHPARVLQLAAIKFGRLWNIWPNEPQFRSWPVRLAVFFTYVPIMVLAVCGAWTFRHRGWPCVLCWLPAVYSTLLHMVFVSSIRYREPAMLPLIVLAAGAAVSWWRSKRGSNQPIR